MKRWLVRTRPSVLAALAAAIALSGPSLVLAARTAAPAGFTEAPVLEPAASYVAGKPVVVWCSTSTFAWQTFLNSNGNLGADARGATVPGSSEVHLDWSDCYVLRAQIRRPAYESQPLAVGIEVLTHEAIHARGESDEGVTDCAAIHQTPGVAVRFFHIRPGADLRGLMADAWAARATLDPIYRTVC